MLAPPTPQLCRANRQWSQEEECLLKQMAQLRHGAKIIARALNRTPRAVYGRSNRLKIVIRRGIVGPVKRPPPPPPPRTVHIRKIDVPYWYAVGWRLVSFEGDLCIFSKAVEEMTS